MRKTFTVKDSEFKVISKGRGTVIFSLVDELGNNRTVYSIAKLDRNNKIISVNAMYKRETPLVYELANASLKDTIMVDFTGYNKAHPRMVKASLRRNPKHFPKVIPQYQTALYASSNRGLLFLMGLSIIAWIISEMNLAHKIIALFKDLIAQLNWW